MVLADVGHVGRAHAVAEHADARSVQATHDRPAHAGAEIGGLHARQRRDHAAERGRAGIVEFGAAQYRDRRDDLVAALAQRRGAHHDRLELLVVMPAVVGIRACGIVGRGRGVGRVEWGGGQRRGDAEDEERAGHGHSTWVGDGQVRVRSRHRRGA